ncbi:hypothetical protein [Maricaulis sp. CAU 1757]
MPGALAEEERESDHGPVAQPALDPVPPLPVASWPAWPFRLCLLFALATLVLVYLMSLPPPPPGAGAMVAGFQSPMLALEFARGAGDLLFLEGEAGAPLREWLMRVQRLDVYFPVAYAGMAILFFIGLTLKGRRLALVGALLALMTIPADWQENRAIDAILAELHNPVCTEETRPADPDAHVSLFECLPEGALDGASPEITAAAFAFDSFVPLHVELLKHDTWVKWGLIALYAAVMAVVMWLEKRRLLALPPALAALAIGATWLSGGAGQVAEVMGLLLIPFMLTFPVAAVMYLRARTAIKREAQ